MSGIEALRKRIDAVDRQILRLLNRRARLVLRVGQIKRRGKLPVVDSRREKAVLERVTRAQTGPLPDASVRRIFREILRCNRRLQRPGGKR